MADENEKKINNSQMRQPKSVRRVKTTAQNGRKRFRRNRKFRRRNAECHRKH